MFINAHYGEIALKGDNRKFFEEKLVQNIKKSLIRNEIFFSFVKRIRGSIFIKIKPSQKADIKEKVIGALQNVFGLSSFSFVDLADLEIKDIIAKSIEILNNKEFNSFKVQTKRTNKNFCFTSPQVNEAVGNAIVEHFQKEVNLRHPQLILYIEIGNKNAFLSTEKFKGLGGLPVGISGKAISLLSGGIDSPVAAWQMMKRGVENIFVHFYALQQGYETSWQKVKQLMAVLNNYQFTSKIYFVPFADVQKEILLKVPLDLRVIFYRRVMFLVAEEIARNEKAEVLITGESVGQVASQTLTNIAVIEQAVTLPVLRPLCGMDKIEIIEIAKKIGTFDISILPALDCCSMFVPSHPQTKADLKRVQKIEKKLNIKKLIKMALSKVKVENL